MIKHYLIMAALAAGIAINAHANMGETRDEAANRYGPPIKSNGSWAVYHTKGWIISHWFNQNGIAEAVYYEKQNGYISQKEQDTIGRVNLPNSFQRDSWYELETNSNTYHVWLSLDDLWRFETGVEKHGKYNYAYFNIMTTRACAAITNEQNGNNQSDTTASTSSTANLPL